MPHTISRSALINRWAESVWTAAPATGAVAFHKRLQGGTGIRRAQREHKQAAEAQTRQPEGTP